MSAYITFPAIGAQQQAGPFNFDPIIGYRLATLFKSQTPGIPIGNDFSVTILVGRCANAPSDPDSLEAGGNDMSQYRGRRANIAITFPSVLAYSINMITLEQTEYRSYSINGQRRNIALLGFRFTRNPLNNSNLLGSGLALNLKWLDSTGANPPTECGTFGFELAERVMLAAKSANNGAPEWGQPEKAPERSVAWGKPLEDISLVKDAATAGGVSGALALISRRGTSNPWIDAMLAQNCAQATAPSGADVPVPGGTPVPGGGLTLHVNGNTWTGGTLGPQIVSGYFVEEVWGWCQSFSSLSPRRACQLLPVGAQTGKSPSDWLMPSLDGFAAQDNPEHDLTHGVVGAVTERVCIRFSGGLRASDTLFA